MGYIKSFHTGIVAILTLLAIPIFGNTLTWNGGGGANANWNVSANWGGVGTPANGDTLIFQGTATQLNTNNLVGLVLNQVKFNGAVGGFTLRGNALGVTNSIIVTNTSIGATIENDINLGASDLSIVVSNTSASLTIKGHIAGVAGVTKTGAGSVIYQCAGDNSYTGTTRINAGTLKLNVSGANAFGGPLIIGDGSGTGTPTVMLLQSSEVPTAASITFNQNATLDLNNFVQTIGTNIMFNGSPSGVQTGTGTLNFFPNATITVAPNVTGSIIGNLNTQIGTLTLQGGDSVNPGYLGFSCHTIGFANIVQNGLLKTTWSGSNSYSGNYTINGQGVAELYTSYALGNVTNTMTLNGQSSVNLSGGIHITNQSLTINSINPAYYGALSVESASTNSWQANFIFGSAASIDTATNCSLILNAVSSISGSGGIVKSGSGSLTLSGPAGVSTYAGDTVVNRGTLFLNSSNVIRNGALIIGPGFGASPTAIVRHLASGCIYDGVGVKINSDGWLDLNGFTDNVGPITMDAALITTGAGTLQLSPPLNIVENFINGPSTINGKIQLTGNTTIAVSNALYINAAISSSGNYTLTKAGGFYMIMTASNSYTGTNIIQEGRVSIQNGSALGNTNNSTIVSNAATLTMTGNFTVAQSSLTLNGPGEFGWGSLDSETVSGTNIWLGPIILNADSTFAPYQFGTTLRLIGQISGPGGFTQFNGGNTNSTLSLEGPTANTYAGTTTVSSGTLVLKTTGVAVPRNLVIAGCASVVRFVLSFQTSPNADILLNSGGLLDLGNNNVAEMDTLRGSGTVKVGTSSYITVGLNGGSSTFDGVISGIGSSFSGYTVAKRGAGTFTSNGNNTFTVGPLHVLDSGKLIVNGSQPQVPVIVDFNASLAGSGTFGTIASEGLIAPGNGPGIMNSSNVTLNSSAKFLVTLNGTNAGTDYSQLNVTGTVDLASATLQITQGGVGAPNSQYTILKNDLGDAITGIFGGLVEGATVTANTGVKFTISYLGGTGNDVVLTQIGLPPQPKFNSIQKLANGTFQLFGTGTNKLTYTVWANTNLTTATWVSIGTATAPSNLGALQFIDTNATNYPQRFYYFSWP
ncbi:MAG: Autotransporter-associated beta strand repeat protein [Verrucomicrobiales bacterium]|nr:Autotransporter-associated beta strand repeat protein [Verrucomicrobiales bacterium]